MTGRLCLVVLFGCFEMSTSCPSLPQSGVCHRLCHGAQVHPCCIDACAAAWQGDAACGHKSSLNLEFDRVAAVSREAADLQKVHTESNAKARRSLAVCCHAKDKFVPCLACDCIHARLYICVSAWAFSLSGLIQCVASLFNSQGPSLSIHRAMAHADLLHAEVQTLKSQNLQLSRIRLCIHTFIVTGAASSPLHACVRKTTNRLVLCPNACTCLCVIDPVDAASKQTAHW